MLTESKEFSSFGEQFSDEARLFAFSEYVNGRSKFWYGILQIHDSYGVPFDLIFRKLQNTNFMKYINLADGTESSLKDVEFEEVMLMTRYGAETYGIGLED